MYDTVKLSDLDVVNLLEKKLIFCLILQAIQWK